MDGFVQIHGDTQPVANVAANVTAHPAQEQFPPYTHDPTNYLRM
jgi:hypothetical protein